MLLAPGCPFGIADGRLRPGVSRDNPNGAGTLDTLLGARIFPMLASTSGEHGIRLVRSRIRSFGLFPCGFRDGPAAGLHSAVVDSQFERLKSRKAKASRFALGFSTFVLVTGNDHVGLLTPTAH